MAPTWHITTVIDRLTEKLTRVLSEPIAIEDLQLCVLASVGVAIYPNDGTTATTLLSAADERMYNAKRAIENKTQPMRSTLRI
jgi:diguanylate cyclase (GGDEF)-like protein